MKKFQLPKLEYEYNALEPYIDKSTMKIHHGKHHQTYIDKLNIALEKHPKLCKEEVDDLLIDLDNIPDDIKIAVKNNGGGHSNHSFFWKILSPKKQDIPKEIKKQIEKDFGSYEEFKKLFSDTAVTLFGSGWAWLVLDDKKLKIMTTFNQDSPISSGKIPLLTIDLWEHSYYLKYQNKRIDYIEAFFNIINWERVNELFLKNK